MSIQALIFACWLCLIAIVGLTRLYDQAPPAAIGVTIVLGTLFVLAMSKFGAKSTTAWRPSPPKI